MSKPSSPPPPPPPPGRVESEVAKRGMPWMWIALVAVVLLAVGFAIATAGDDEELVEGTVPAATDEPGTDGSATDDTADATDGTTGGATAEVWPVTVTGDPLPPLGDGADPAVGTAAPQLSGFTFDGTPVQIDPAQGPVMLVFLAHWCPHCNRELPELLAWKASGAVPDGLQVIAVTTAVDPTRENFPPSEWIVDMGWDWPVLADSISSDAAVAMGVSGFPFSVIVGTDGTVLGRVSGELGQAGIQAWVDSTLA